MVWFRKADKKKYSPSFDELLLCFDVEIGEYIIPDFLPKVQVRRAIGNGVCVSMAKTLGSTLIECVFRMKPDGDGYFIPIDSSPDDPEDGWTVATTDTPQKSNDSSLGHLYRLEQARALIEMNNDLVKKGLVADPNLIDGSASTPAASESSSVRDEVVASVKPDDPILQVGLQADDSRSKPVITTSIPVPATTKFYETGFVVYEGPSKINGERIVAILTLNSNNIKTGNMAQLWILAADVAPMEALKTGADQAVCGDCQFRKGICYVEVAKAPTKIWEAWKRDAYPFLPMKHYNVLSGKSIRLGAYGDPYAVPVTILKELANAASNYTGYTHQWKNPAAAELKTLCMASVDNPDEYKQANEMGWRTFRVIRNEDALMEGEILCPNLTSGVQCVDCNLCKGSITQAKNIAIEVHGNGKNKFHADVPVIEVNTSQDVALLRNVSASDIIPVNVNSSRMISSVDLTMIHHRELHFGDRWNDLFGHPSPDFHCVIYGLPGQGKSTFAILFAKYLADHFGRTLFVSGEEGFSKTFKDKFVNNDATSEFLDVADIRSYDEFWQMVPRDSYNFIILDSLDSMKINTDGLTKIKDTFKNVAFITVSRVTKEGYIRGSIDRIYDSNIVVCVDRGIAKTTRNRFKKDGMIFNVFEK